MKRNWTGPILAVGLAGVLAANYIGWRRDKEKLRIWRDRLRQEVELKRYPLVSILLPAWNEQERLGACLDSLLALRYPNLEIIVCAGGHDRTQDIAGNYADKRLKTLEQKPGEGKQRALQRCYEDSSGEIIYLTDADCVVSDQAFEATIAPVVSGDEKVSTGFWEPLLFQKNNPFVRFQWASHLNREIFMPVYADALDGKNAAIHRLILNEIGAFRPPAPIGTDYLMSRNLLASGYQILSVFGSRVQTEYPERIKDYIRQISRWFRNRLVLGWKMNSNTDVRTSLQAGLGSLFMLGAPVSANLFRSPILWVSWIILALKEFLTQARFANLANLTGQMGSVGWLVMTPFYLTISWIAMLKGLIESQNKLRREMW